MSSRDRGGGRFRAYLQFIAAVCYFFLARSLAQHGAQGLAGPAWTSLVEQAMLVFLLLLGYAAMGSWMDRQSGPIAAQGLAAMSGGAVAKDSAELKAAQKPIGEVTLAVAPAIARLVGAGN